MPIPQDLEVYAGQSTVRCLDLYMGQGNTTVETQATYDFLIFTVGLTQPFQFAVPFTWLKDSGWSKDYLIITCLWICYLQKYSPCRAGTLKYFEEHGEKFCFFVIMKGRPSRLTRIALMLEWHFFMSSVAQQTAENYFQMTISDTFPLNIT